MIIDTIITKVGNSLYALIPRDIRDLFYIDNGDKGTIEISKGKITITFILKDKEEEKNEKDTIRR